MRLFDHIHAIVVSLSRFPITFPPALILILILIQLFFIRPYFALNDDTFKVFFTQGVGTDLVPSDFIGYSNPLWGLVFKTLFTVFPNVPWYGYIMIATQFLSLMALYFAFITSPNPRFKFFLFLSAFICILSSFFISLQYTVTASLAAQGGIFLAFGLWRNQKTIKKPFSWCLAGFLIFLSSIIRLDGFSVTFLAVLPFIVWTWLVQRNDPHQNVGPFPKKFLIIVSSVILLGALYSHFWYSRDPGWLEFNRFDHERLALQDYRIDPYNLKTKPYFDSAGWTENDYWMFKDWYFMDPDIYDTEKMGKLASFFPRVGSQGKPASLHSLPDILADPAMQIILGLSIACFLMCPISTWVFGIVQSIWLTGLFCLLIYFFRAPPRVVLPLATILLNCGIFLALPLPTEKISFNWRSITGALFLAIFTLQGLFFFIRDHRENLLSRAVEEKLTDYVHMLNPRDNQLFVIWDSSFEYESFSVFNNFNIFRNFHIFELAVYQRSPNAQKMLMKFGVKNLFRDMVDRQDIFLIASQLEGAMYRQYMREKHHMEIYPEKYFECPFFKVYRIHSKPPSLTSKPGSRIKKLINK